MIYREQLGATPLPLTEADQPDYGRSYYYDDPGVDSRLAAHDAAATAESSGWLDLSARAMDVVEYGDETSRIVYESRQESTGGGNVFTNLLSALTKPRTSPLASGQAQAKNPLISYGVPVAVGIGALLVIAAASK